MVNENFLNASYAMMVDDLECVWNLSTLIGKSKNIEAKKVPLNQFNLDVWVWGADKPQDHVERIFNCDLSYPILIWDGNVLDGYHRILKAHLLGLDYIMAKEIINIPPPDDILDVPKYSTDQSSHTIYLSDLLETLKIVRKCLNGYPSRHEIDGF